MAEKPDPEGFDSIDLYSLEIKKLEEMASKVLKFTIYRTRDDLLSFTSDKGNKTPDIIFSRKPNNKKLKLLDNRESYDTKERQLNYQYEKMRLEKLRQCGELSCIQSLK